MSLSGYNPYTYTRGFRNQEFHHAVLSVSGNIHTLYLDGSMVVQNVAAGNIFASYQTITNTVIGAQTTLSQAFQGTIGDVRIYNYAIPATTVSSLYRDRNLVVYYPFDTSVNNLTPNYATLVYDASLIGQPLISASSGANIGTGALALSNTAGAVATQYVKTTPGIAGQVGWNLNATNGLTIACWINVAGVAGRIQRIFDIPLSVNQKGLSIDISGTNQIYSGWNPPPLPPGPLDKISTATLSYFTNPTQVSSGGACAFGLKLLYSKYTGPIIRIRKSTYATAADEIDFYADTSGNFGTAYLGTGTSLSSWLGAATAYVATWYDQTGNGKHATVGNTNAYPILRNNTYTAFTSTAPTGYYINFPLPVSGNAYYLSLPSNAFPYGNSSYSYVVKTYCAQPNIPSNKALLNGGTGVGGSFLAQYNTAGYFKHFWRGSAALEKQTPGNQSNVYLNYVSTFSFNSSSKNRYNYVNGPSELSDNNATNRNQLSSPNYIAYSHYANPSTSVDAVANTNLYYVYALPYDLTLNSADKAILEAT